MSASVLIVDRNRFVRHLLREVLEEAGYQVWAVATASFARSLVTSHGEQFDLVLLYVRSASDENVDFVRTLKASGFDRPIVTLCVDAAKSQETFAAGVSASIQAPFTIEELLRQLELLIRHRGKRAPVLHRPKFYSASRR